MKNRSENEIKSEDINFINQQASLSCAILNYPSKTLFLNKWTAARI